VLPRLHTPVSLLTSPLGAIVILCAHRRQRPSSCTPDLHTPFAAHLPSVAIVHHVVSRLPRGVWTRGHAHFALRAVASTSQPCCAGITYAPVRRIMLIDPGSIARSASGHRPHAFVGCSCCRVLGRPAVAVLVTVVAGRQAPQRAGRGIARPPACAISSSSQPPPCRAVTADSHSDNRRRTRALGEAVSSWWRQVRTYASREDRKSEPPPRDFVVVARAAGRDTDVRPWSCETSPAGKSAVDIPAGHAPFSVAVSPRCAEQSRRGTFHAASCADSPGNPPGCDKSERRAVIPLCRWEQRRKFRSSTNSSVVQPLS
jgi:hypothetical protein